MDYKTAVKGMTKEAWKGIALIFLFVAVVGVIASFTPSIFIDEYYQAYTLNDK